MKKIHALIIPVFLVVSLPSLKGYATEPAFFKIENSSPQSELTHLWRTLSKLEGRFC